MHTSKFGIAAMSGATHPAHNSRHGLTSGQLPTGIVFYLAYTFDATHRINFKPGTLTHFGFRTIDAKSSHFNHHLAILWVRCRHLSEHQLLRSTVLLDD